MGLSKVRALLAASVAGILAAMGTVWSGQQAQAAEEGEVSCYGVNKCQGVGECGGKGHGCAGLNECSGQGYLTLKEEDCLRIADGRLTVEPEPDVEAEEGIEEF